MNVGLDQYDRNARLKPALLLMLPATLTVIALAPNAVLGWGGAVAAVIQAGGSFLLAHVVGDIGKKKEPQLFKHFGGRPTERLLCHEHAPNKVVLAERHRKLAELLTNVKIPTPYSEKKNAAGALAIYAAGCDKLRALARAEKEKFSHVHRENIHYGFRRNLWALKPWGLIVTSVALVFVAVEIYGRVADHQEVSLLFPGVAVVEAAFLLSWIFLITREWVKRAAMLYAERLMEVLDTLK